MYESSVYHMCTIYVVFAQMEISELCAQIMKKFRQLWLLQHINTQYNTPAVIT